MILVVDASIVTKWLMEEPGSPEAQRLLESHHQFVAIDFLRLEVSNAVLRGQRKGRVPPAVAQRSIDGLDRLPIRLVPANSHIGTAYALALRHGGSIYDCCYIALARSLDVGLATDDSGMAVVGEAAGVLVHRATGGFAALLD